MQMQQKAPVVGFMGGKKKTTLAPEILPLQGQKAVSLPDSLTYTHPGVAVMPSSFSFCLCFLSLSEHSLL